MNFDVFRRGAVAGLLTAALTASAAFADVSGFLGNWVNPTSGSGSFLGSLVGSSSDNSDIARIVVTEAGASHVRIHLFGRCPSGTCDWGIQVGRNHSGDPASDEVRSIAADFDTGFAQKRLTLSPGPGHSLRFDVVTDFTDRSGRHDYETSGSLTLAPAAGPVASTARAPAAPVSTPVGAAAAGSSIPSASAASSTDLAAGGMTEDCTAINPADVYVAPPGRAWKLNDFNHTILKFGDNKVAALKAQAVLGYYHIDEQCFVTRADPKMMYWRVAGEVPRASMPGQDCIAVLPAKVQAVETGGTWKVVDGSTVLIDYGADKDGAQQAVSVIRTYRLSRQCFVAKPDETMVYWLAQ